MLIFTANKPSLIICTAKKKWLQKQKIRFSMFFTDTNKNEMVTTFCVRIIYDRKIIRNSDLRNCIIENSNGNATNASPYTPSITFKMYLISYRHIHWLSMANVLTNLATVRTSKFATKINEKQNNYHRWTISFGVQHVVHLHIHSGGSDIRTTK